MSTSSLLELELLLSESYAIISNISFKSRLKGYVFVKTNYLQFKTKKTSSKLTFEHPPLLVQKGLEKKREN
jgi:hypothetical protein